MHRREFLASASAVIAASTGIYQRLFSNDAAEIRRTIIAWTEAFSNRSIDHQQYLAFMTSDYQAAENGEIVDLTAELRAREKLPVAFERTHRFNFRKVEVSGGKASVELVLDAEISDGRHGVRRQSWAGHVELRRVGDKWLASSLRSATIEAIA